MSIKESERSDAGEKIVVEVIVMVKRDFDPERSGGCGFCEEKGRCLR